ncbi:MAG: ComEC/Rec2 family competence protein, partial [Phycisphaeraceae bacterium]
MGRPDRQVEGELRQRRRPFAVVALCWMLGIVLGAVVSSAAVWLLVSAGTGALALACWRRRPCAVHRWILIALVATSASWAVVRQRHVPADSVRQYLLPQPQLAELVGTVDGPPYLSPPARGAFAPFSYKSPATLFVLRLESIVVGGEPRKVSGRLLVRMDRADHRLRSGQRVGVTGWLSAIVGPANPGERDYRRILADRGIAGRLALGSVGNIERLGGVSPRSWFGRMRQAISAEAARSLRLGMSRDPQRLALLDALLLGRRSAEL